MSLDIKGYWKSVFLDNWQTTSVGMTTIITSIVDYAYLWTHPPPGAPPGMPDPHSYLVPFLAALFLVFRATDPPKAPPP